MKNTLNNKTNCIISLAKKNTSITVKPRLKDVIRVSNDSLSKSIRSKKDAQTFINELKGTLKNIQ